MASHTQNPVAEHVAGDIFRVYFSSRDEENRSHVGWLEIDISRPDDILNLAEAPLLAPGRPGAFDDAGAMTSCLVRHDGQRYFYYIGWSLRADAGAPYHVAIGLAVGAGGADGAPKVTRLSRPILDRNPVDPLFCLAPYVMIEESRWRMWYLSGLGWVSCRGRRLPSYHVRYAESVNGLDWERDGTVVLELNPGELGFTRPCVLSEHDGYVVWYSVRGEDARYRLGCAHSDDGLVWERENDRAGLEASRDGWDSEMTAYPYVFTHRGAQYMLYCGNEYGRTGFGLAVRG